MTSSDIIATSVEWW